ncbi:MAG: flagellar hook-associated protein FlgL, partial [Leptothrix sp. (in: b-proteobacteria)]
MRVATSTAYESTVNTLQRRQQELTSAQAQMTSGKKISQASDDPTGAARAERALIEQTRGETTLRAIDASRNAMTLSESAIGDAVNLTQTAREALVAAGNGSYSAGDRKALAVQLRELRGQLLNVANQQDGNGGFLFGGQGIQTAPFSDAVGGVQYNSTAGQLNGSSTEQLPLSVDGQQVWLQARSGNGVFETGAAAANTGTGWIGAGQVTNPSALTGQSYSVSFANNASTGALEYSVTDSATGAPANDSSGNPITAKPYNAGKAITDVPGMSFTVSGTPAAADRFSIAPSQPNLSVFAALDRSLAVLEDPNANGGQVMQAVTNGLRDLDQSLSTMQSARSVVGETLNRLDGLGSRTDARILSAKTTRSNAEDLDMVQAISDFSNKQTGYQAALQSYSMV